MSTPRPGRDVGDHQVRDLIRWAALAAVGVLIALLADGRADGVGAVLPTDRYGAFDPTATPWTALAPVVAVVVLVAIAAGWVDRMPWWPLQVAAWIAAAAWTAGLGLVDGGDTAAGAVGGPDGAADDGQAPGARLILRWLSPVADDSPALLTIGLAVGSALAVPFVAAAVHSLCGQVQARRLMPLLILAPYAAWSTAGVGGVVGTLCAAMLALGVMAGERGRGLRWQLPLATASGLLLGCAALAWYGALILAVGLLAVYFVRRRALLIPLTAVAMLIPLWIAALAGHSWVDGFGSLRMPWTAGDTGRVVVLLAVDLTALLVVCGPAYVASMRKLRNTPGWPFLAGATAGLVFWAITGLPETSPADAWLPYLPWLLVAAVAPPKPAGKPVPAPLILAAAGAVIAVVLRILLRPT